MILNDTIPAGIVPGENDSMAAASALTSCRGDAGWKMADILRMIVGEDETFVTLGLKRDGEAFSTSIKRSAKPMISGHTPVLAYPLHECHPAVPLRATCLQLVSMAQAVHAHACNTPVHTHNRAP